MPDEERDLNGRAEQIGRVVRKRFERLAERSELVGDVRGLGAMIGLELCHGRDPQRPATDAMAAVAASCRARGVLVLPAGRDGNVLRLLSPLVITDEQLDHGLTVIEESLLALTEKTPA